MKRNQCREGRSGKVGTGVGGKEECKYLHGWVNLIPTDKMKLGRKEVWLGRQRELSENDRACWMPSSSLGRSVHSYIIQRPNRDSDKKHCISQRQRHEGNMEPCDTEACCSPTTDRAPKACEGLSDQALQEKSALTSTSQTLSQTEV